ncbi:hypothetical protein LAUMK4_01588 [Mycobacterium persicum]|uniref:Uncharacterized protein n=1 Tax=Mycobacterium persicum TaxID=1487726 RepID=A0AB38UR06_9MYCO|nr:hypothetical protein LAUMK15_01953 [Mycobacterium persicum]VAZ82994.1 hypothetical protein LAUMK42_01806 [Mycobacterium persicum]VAZ90971.1 hypothetical protein LAUMK4_01588 [Mycobacterium persicum]
MQIRWDRGVLHRQRGLDEPRDPGRRLQMPDIGLHRPQRARTLAPAICRRQRLELDRIAQHRAGSMGFDIVHAFGCDVTRSQRIGDHVALGRCIRRSDPVGAAVLVDRRAADHRQHPVAVAHRVGQPLEHHHAGALAAHEPVGRRVEGGAPALWGQQSPGRYRDLRLRAKGDADAAGQRQVRFPQPQALTGQVYRHQRRRTRGVHRHCGTA